MKISSHKRYLFRYSIVLVLLISVFICLYALVSYKGSNNNLTLNKNFNIEGNFANNYENAPESMPFSNSPHDFSNSNEKQSGPNADKDMENSNLEDKPGDNQDQKSEWKNNIQKGLNGEQKGNMEQRQFGGNMQRGEENTKYFSALNIYSIIFLILTCAVYYLIKHKKYEINSRDEKLTIFALSAVGFLLRIAASTLIEGYTGDINLFRSWAQTAANGFSNFYANARQADYPPLYIYVLGVIGKLASIIPFNSYYVLLLKIPSITADIGAAYFIYKLGKRHLSTAISILLAAFYIFNPAIFIDSALWGQVDSFFTSLIIIAIYLLCEKKYTLSSAVFAAAILMKPQGIIFLPILFFELVRQKKLKNFIYCAISALVTTLIIIMPFSLNQQSPLWIINLYQKTISEYPYASVNGFNFFSLIGGNYKKYDAKLFIVSYHTIGMAFIVITTLIGWILYAKGNDKKYVSAIELLQIAGVFTFSVGMHERYLFPAVALAVLAFVYLKDKRFFILAIGFSITSYTNIAAVLFSANTSIFNGILEITAILNIVLVIYLIRVIFDNVVIKAPMTLNQEKSKTT